MREGNHLLDGRSCTVACAKASTVGLINGVPFLVAGYDDGQSGTFVA